MPPGPWSGPDPSVVSRRLFFALDVSVVDGLADRLEVVDVPKQEVIAPMRSLVVHDRAVRVEMLGAEEAACALAGPVVALQHLQAERLPSAGLVPGLPWCAVLDWLGQG